MHFHLFPPPPMPLMPMLLSGVLAFAVGVFLACRGGVAFWRGSCQRSEKGSSQGIRKESTTRLLKIVAGRRLRSSKSRPVSSVGSSMVLGVLPTLHRGVPQVGPERHESIVRNYGRASGPVSVRRCFQY
jgi:hypothetical protein